MSNRTKDGAVEPVEAALGRKEAKSAAFGDDDAGSDVADLDDLASGHDKDLLSPAHTGLGVFGRNEGGSVRLDATTAATVAGAATGDASRGGSIERHQRGHDSSSSRDDHEAHDTLVAL